MIIWHKQFVPDLRSIQIPRELTTLLFSSRKEIKNESFKLRKFASQFQNNPELQFRVCFE